MPHVDAAALAAALTPAAAVGVITAALAAGFDPAGDPARSMVPTRHGQFLLMPSEIGGSAGVKVATVAPGNPAAGRPRIQATYLLFDAATLTLRATLDGTALTTLRTSAVSVAAVRPALDRLDGAARIVVFGAGPQARGHAATLTAVLRRPPDSITFLVRRPDRARVGPAGALVTAGSAAAATALAAADVVVCATGARTPLFAGDAVPAAAVVIAVGSHEPDARELPGALLAASTVVVEDPATALREAGDVVLAVREGHLSADALVPMRDVVAGAARLPTGRPVVFKSVGMSWQDLAIAGAVSGAIAELGAGTGNDPGRG